jgi:hypothetical protein
LASFNQVSLFVALEISGIIVFVSIYLAYFSRVLYLLEFGKLESAEQSSVSSLDAANFSLVYLLEFGKFAAAKELCFVFLNLANSSHFWSSLEYLFLSFFVVFEHLLFGLRPTAKF